MVMAEEFVRQSQLLDQLVLDRATMDECGRIEVMWSYPKVHRVLGFICKAGRFDRTKLAFNLDQIEKIGENGVLVSSVPVETDRDRVQQLETLIGCEVWSDEGKRVGRINDYVFQLESGNIRFYLLGSGGLQGLAGKLYSLYPSQILGYGRGRVMVSAGVVPGLELYQVGLDQKIEQKFVGLEERLESKIKRTADRINEQINERINDEQLNQSLQSGVRSWVDRARSVTADVTAKVKDRAQEFLEDSFVEEAPIGRRVDSQTVNFDFEDWEDEPREKRDRDREPDRESDCEPDRESLREPNREQPQRRQRFDEWSDDRMSDRLDEQYEKRVRDRPPLPNLSPKNPSSTGFTAQPRPVDGKKGEGLGRDDLWSVGDHRDVWDDDEWV
jgi:uncharacterized protein YrrD